jgi:hypothetical protein
LRKIAIDDFTDIDGLRVATQDDDYDGMPGLNVIRL